MMSQLLAVFPAVLWSNSSDENEKLCNVRLATVQFCQSRQKPGVGTTALFVLVHF